MSSAIACKIQSREANIFHDTIDFLLQHSRPVRKQSEKEASGAIKIENALCAWLPRMGSNLAECDLEASKKHETTCLKKQPTAHL